MLRLLCRLGCDNLRLDGAAAITVIEGEAHLAYFRLLFELDGRVMLVEFGPAVFDSDGAAEVHHAADF